MKKLAMMSPEGSLGLLLSLAGTVLFLAGILSVMLLYAFNIDEGYNSQVSLNLLRYGVCGSKTLDGLRWFDSHVSTGPVVLLPVAISFLGLGDGILQARLVSQAFVLLSLLILTVLARRLYGPVAAGLAVLLFVTTRKGFTILGMVLGEGAAVCMFVAGLLLWSYTEEKRSPALACGAGILWGLSVWAKPSMAMAVLFIVVGLPICVLVREPLGKTLPALAAATSIAVAATWFVLPVLFSVQSGYLLQSGANSSLVAQQLKLTIGKNALRNFRILLQMQGLAVPLATPFGIRHLRQSQSLRTSKLLVHVVPTAWIDWWFLFSEFPIYQHLVPGLLIGSVPLAHVVILLFRRKGGVAFNIYRIVLVGLVTAGVNLSTLSIADHFKGLREPYEQRKAQERFAAQVASLDPDAIVLGIDWFMAWETAFLTDRSFGRITSAAELPEGRSFLIVTPTIQWNIERSQRVLDIVERCSGEIMFDEPPWYRLYRVDAPCSDC
ncbi:ArnT family glycosyltransferase [Chloroflexota bacterium]